MKKKTLTLCLVLSLALTAIGGTLAYFTDTDNETNEFTIGKVDIDLQENFDEDNAKLMPGIDINKDVAIYVEEGSETSYVWYEWLIPAVLDTTDGTTGTDNIVHVNSNGRTWDTYRENEKYWIEGQTEALPLAQTWDHDPNGELSELVGPEGFIGTEEIDGITYNKYLVLYHGTVGAGEKTTEAMTKVYLDSRVDMDPVTNEYTFDGKAIDYDFSNGVDIIVRAYGIQAAGFDDVYAAYTAYTEQTK